MQKLLLLLLLLSLLVGCSEDNKSTISLEQTEVTLKNGETYQINAKSDNKLTYSSEYVYHASVSETGLVTANKVGETNISLTDGEDTKHVRVIVEPRYYLYTFPNISFGMSKNDVIRKLGKPDADKPGMIVYNINYIDNVTSLGCFFNASDKLNSCNVMLKSATEQQMAAFLNERYVLMTAQSGAKAYFNALTLPEATMIVIPQLSSSAWIVTHQVFPSN